MNISNLILFFKQKLKLIIWFFIVLILFLIISKRGVLQVSVQNNTGSVTYEILNQKSNKIINGNNKGGDFKKRLSKGNYEVTVSNDTGSTFFLVQIKGFFHKSYSKIEIKPDKSRQFLGNNPAPCSFTLNEVLYSYYCEGRFNSIQKHVPATKSQPTYIQKIGGLNSSAVEGIINSKLGKLALLKLETSGDNPPKFPHVLYALKSGAKLAKIKEFTDLDSNKSYSIKPFKQGLLVYDSNFSEIKFYPSIATKAININIDKPKDSKQKPYSLSVQGDNIYLVYSDYYRDIADHNISSSKVKSTVAIYNDKSKLFTIDRYFSSISQCGINKICAVEEDSGKDQFSSMAVYETVGSRLKFLYRIGNVSNLVDTNNDKILLVNNKGVYAYNANKRLGLLEYSFGSYNYCGLQVIEPEKYLLCVTSEGGKNYALLINNGFENKDNIDKKIPEIAKSEYIKLISVYKKSIYIDPVLGELIYNSNTNGFEYSASAVNSAEDAIRSEVNKADLDPSYKVYINYID